MLFITYYFELKFKVGAPQQHIALAFDIIMSWPSWRFVRILTPCNRHL